MSRLNRLLLVAVTGAAVLLASHSASAGVRVWENNKDDPDTYQYFDVGGFVQPGFLWEQDDPTTAQYSQNHNTGFYLQRARVNVALQLTKYFIARFELEMTGVPALQDAYVESDIFSWLHIRAGQFLVPFLQTFQFGEANISFLDREIYTPLAPLRGFLPYLSPRDVGLSISGMVGDVSPGAKRPVFEYALGLFNGKGANGGANTNNAFEYTARLQLHILGLAQGRQWESDLARNASPHVSVAAGGYTNCDQFGNWDRGFTTDAEFRYQGIYASASFVYFNNGPASGGNDLGYGQFCGKGQVPPNIGSGGHVQAQYLLPAGWFGPTGGGLELLVRWDQVTPFAAPSGGFLGSTSPTARGFSQPTNYDDQSVAPARWRTTVGVNWYPIRLQSLRLSLNYQFTYQTEPIVANGQDILLSPSLIWLQLTAGI